MRILHLPYNVASQISITVRALRDIGVDARGLVLNSIPIQDDRGIDTHFIRRPYWKNPVRTARQSIRWMRAFLSAVGWADVIHWHFAVANFPLALDLKYIARLNKPRLVEFWGTDIRNPERAGSDNPYFFELMKDEEAYPISSRSSRRYQRRFADAGFDCLIPGPELFDYLLPDLFPAPYRIEAALPVLEIQPAYPDPEKKNPVVCHMPSHPKIKGTEHVLSAVRQLGRELDFEFRLIQDVPRQHVLDLVRTCDIVLDQFIIGSYGTVALEAMALGKPVLCYIKPAFLSRLPAGFPIVNANPDNLVPVLRDLLKSGRLRNDIGRKSRSYAEKHHDSRVVARQLVDVYRNVIEKQTRK